MKNALIVAALASVCLVSSGASAKDWFDSCTTTAKDGKNAYVGGAGNKAHLHVGPNFIDDTRNPTGHGGRYTTDFPKKQLDSKCASLKTWKDSVKTSDSSHYTTPNDVVACLGHFMTEIGCK